jgi:hypothetical protein
MSTRDASYTAFICKNCSRNDVLAWLVGTTEADEDEPA